MYSERVGGLSKMGIVNIHSKYFSFVLSGSDLVGADRSYYNSSWGKSCPNYLVFYVEVCVWSVFGLSLTCPRSVLGRCQVCAGVKVSRTLCKIYVFSALRLCSQALPKWPIMLQLTVHRALRGKYNDSYRNRNSQHSCSILVTLANYEKLLLF